MSEEKTYIMLLEEAKKQRDEEIQRLNYKLQQKENIIKEVREYIERYRKNKEKLQGVFLCSSKLLEILDKENKEVN